MARMNQTSDEARHHLDEAEALFLVASALAGNADLQRVLDTAVAAVVEAMGLQAAAISLFEATDSKSTPDADAPRAVEAPEAIPADTGSNPQDDRPLVLRATIGLPEAVIHAGVLEGNEVEQMERVTHGGVTRVEDLAADPDWVRTPEAVDAGLGAMMSTTVRYRDQALGVLRVYADGPRRFSSFEARLLQTIGELLGTGVHNARLEARRREYRQVERQLKLGAEVQKQMLPALPSVPGVELAARYVPSLDLAGDFYDFIPLNGHLGIAIGDVVGKGVPAALLMAAARASLRAYAHETYDLHEILRKVNDALYRDSRDHEFTTLFYSVLNPQTLRLTYCNAGHEPGLLVRDGEVRQLRTGGTIVGAIPDLRFQTGIFDLRRGDTLLLYTDGLPEAMNFDDELFGRARTRLALRDACADPSLNAEGILNHVLWEKRRFTGIRRPFDDTTMVVMRLVE